MRVGYDACLLTLRGPVLPSEWSCAGGDLRPGTERDLRPGTDGIFSRDWSLAGGAVRRSMKRRADKLMRVEVTPNMKPWKYTFQVLSICSNANPVYHHPHSN